MISTSGLSALIAVSISWPVTGARSSPTSFLYSELVSGIIKSLAHCLLENIRAILGRTRGQDVRPADGPRGAKHLEHTFGSFRASKGADFRQMGKTRMLFP